MGLHDSYRQLMRWYPQRWRDEHGDALLGTLLDDAEYHGRTSPTWGEAVSIVVHGLGTRLDRRSSLAFAVAGIVAALGSGALLMFGMSALDAAGAAWVVHALGGGIASALVALAVVALARHHLWVSPPRALLLAMLAVVSFTLSALTRMSWSQGFDAADAGLTATGLAAAFIWLGAAAWACGALTVAVLVAGLVRRSGLHGAVRAIIATVAGVVGAPIMGVSSLSPGATAVAGVGVLALAVVPALVARRAPSESPAVAGEAAAMPAPASAEGVGHGMQLAIRALAWVAAAGCAASVTFALAGSMIVAGVDATVAMRQGIIASLLCGFVLLVGVGLLATARRRIRLVHVWGPVLVAALSLLSIVAAYVLDGGSGSAVFVLMLAASSCLGGVAVAWWLALRLRVSRQSRVTLAVLLGVGYVFVVGIALAPVLAFVLPVVAVVFAIVAVPRPGTRPDAPVPVLTPAS